MKVGESPAIPPANDEATNAPSIGNMSTVSTMVIDRGLPEVGRECIDCHKELQPGIINDWKDSRHGHVGVGCLDCHAVDESSPMATQHETLVGTDIFITALVTTETCGRCHATEAEQFGESGHFRAYHQQSSTGEPARTDLEA